MNGWKASFNYKFQFQITGYKLQTANYKLQNCKLEIAKLQITDYKGDKRAVHNLGAGSPTHPPEVRKWWNKTKHRLLDACYVDERGKAFR